MREDWARPGTHAPLTDLPPRRAPRRVPAWAALLGVFALGVVLTAGLFGLTGMLDGDAPTPDETRTAYDRGLAEGERRAAERLAAAAAEAEQAAYARGWRAGGFAANPARASAFEISPLMHFAVPLGDVPPGWLAECPDAVPTLLLLLAGVSGCNDSAP
jgi:hypothetical protein